jgi:hypothetical protein
MKEIGDLVQYAVVASQGTKLLQSYSTLNIICLDRWLLNHSATLRTTPESNTTCYNCANQPVPDIFFHVHTHPTNREK